MTVLWRDDYSWINGAILSANTVAFWDWLDAALDTLNGIETDDETVLFNRSMTAAVLIPHARRSHACQYRADDLSGPCLPGRLIGAQVSETVGDGYDELWLP
jgi:hypothetical protein